MMFCPKCSALMVNKAEKKGITCNQCGFTAKDAVKTKIIEEIKTPMQKIQVVSDSEDKTLPLTDAECENCHHSKAFYWLVQTRAGDEAETKFLRCQKCKHTWREYD